MVAEGGRLRVGRGSVRTVDVSGVAACCVRCVGQRLFYEVRKIYVSRKTSEMGCGLQSRLWKREGHKTETFNCPIII